jgi:hypothetical protein
MLKCDTHSYVWKVIGLIILFFLVGILSFSQTILLNGIVKDEHTAKPLSEVNIKIAGTGKGTSTDKSGNFSLLIDKIPLTLVITCIGYQDAFYDLRSVSKSSVEFLLNPKSYTLGEVDISSKKYSFLFKDKDYSVMDYAIMDDNILILIYRYQLKQSELILLSRSGDTLAISDLPEVPPASLFKDFLANVHYFSRSGNAYQCFYNRNDKTLEYLYKTPLDSLLKFVKPFLFKISDRLFFQESVETGFGTAVGYYQKGSGKKYIRKYINMNKLSEYYDDQRFYASWNIFVATYGTNPYVHFTIPSESGENPEFDFSKGDSTGSFYEKNEARAHQIEFFKMIYPVVRTEDNNIAFFNFGRDTLELMDDNGKLIRSINITFHKDSIPRVDSNHSIYSSNVSWRWGNSILTDAFNHEVYTLYLKNGTVKIRKINLATGKLNYGTTLAFPFPEKIEIYKGEAYFLSKDTGENEKWKLVRCKL